MIGQGHASRRIINKKAHKAGKILGANQDGSREFVTLLACIRATGSRIPPTLIYQGQSHDLLDTWVEGLNNTEAYFAVSEKGWTNNELGLQWLEKVFDKCTKAKVGWSRRRLLIVDGHSSHVNLPFLEYAHSHSIIVLVFPPHTTHRLQPLDVSLFSPSAKRYSQELDTVMRNSLGITSITKQIFWSLFYSAWQKSFTTENIQSAFKVTGIFPIDSSYVLDTLNPPQTPQRSAPVQAKTPVTFISFRYAIRMQKKEPSTERLKKIEDGFAKVITERDLDRATVGQLTTALVVEKKKKQQGKRLNLLGEEDVGPQVFTPTAIQIAQTRKAVREEEEEQKKEENKKKRRGSAATFEKAVREGRTTGGTRNCPTTSARREGRKASRKNCQQRS